MKDVFISYNSLDEEETVRVREQLEAQGVSCWMAPRDIPFGYDYTQAIPAAIMDCPIFMVVMTRNTQNSFWVPREMEMAVNAQKRIIPIMLDNVKLNLQFSLLIHTSQKCFALNGAPLPETLFQDIKAHIGK